MPVRYVVSSDVKKSLVNNGLKFYKTDLLNKSYGVDAKDFVIDENVLARKLGGQHAWEEILKSAPKQEKPDRHEIYLLTKKGSIGMTQDFSRGPF